MPNKKKGRRNRMSRQAKLPNPFKGVKFTPNYDPPQFNRTPWWDVVLNFEDPYQAGVAYELTPGNFRGRLASNFGIPTNSIPNFVFRINRVRAWSVASAASVSPSIALDVHSLVPTVSDDITPTAPRAVYYGTLARLLDSGTLNRPAAVGYEYPLMDKSQIITADQKFVVATYSAGGDGYLRVYFNISFSFAGVAPPVPAPTTTPVLGGPIPISESAHSNLEQSFGSWREWELHHTQRAY